MDVVQEDATFQERIERIIYKYRFLLVFSLIALSLIGFGIFLFRSGIFESTKIEVLETETAKDPQKLIVEISGSVEKPGVYKLDSSNRVEDLLILAGGLSVSADRGWVETSLNRAAKLTDGQKIYIPRQGEASNASLSLGGVGPTININTASSSQLETLWGIGEARATSIIENRPYSNVEELLTKKVIPSNVFEKIKEKISI